MLDTVTLHPREKSSKYAAILWFISSQLDHEVLTSRAVTPKPHMAMRGRIPKRGHGALVEQSPTLTYVAKCRRFANLLRTITAPHFIAWGAIERAS